MTNNLKTYILYMRLEKCFLFLFTLIGAQIRNLTDDWLKGGTSRSDVYRNLLLNLILMHLLSLHVENAVRKS